VCRAATTICKHRSSIIERRVLERIVELKLQHTLLLWPTN
jgi:hypothetical protein